jgi:hypothetical protein
MQTANIVEHNADRQLPGLLEFLHGNPAQLVKFQLFHGHKEMFFWPQRHEGTKNTIL